MTATCPTCSRPVHANARFCGGCGSPVALGAPIESPPFVPPSAMAAEEKGFSSGRMLKAGWRITRDNLWPAVALFGLALLIWIVGWVVAALVFQAVTPDWVTGLLVTLVFFLLGAVLMMGMYAAALRWADGGSGRVADLFGAAPRAFAFILASLLYLAIVSVGLLLLVVPGIVWALSFGMYPFMIVDKGLGPVAALKASAQVTSGAKWDLLALGLILQYIVIFGLYAFVIGLFVAVPVALIAWALAYRWLEARTAITNA